MARERVVDEAGIERLLDVDVGNSLDTRSLISLGSSAMRFTNTLLRS